MPAACGWEAVGASPAWTSAGWTNSRQAKCPLCIRKLFGRAEGMLSEECTGGFCPAGLKTKSGRLWFSTFKGVVVVDPRLQPGIGPMPNTVLEEVLVDKVPVPMLHFSNPDTEPAAPPGKAASSRQTLRITPGKHRVEFRYTGLSFDAPEEMRFSLPAGRAGFGLGGCRNPAHGILQLSAPGRLPVPRGCLQRDGVWDENESGLALTVSRHFLADMVVHHHWAGLSLLFGGWRRPHHGKK